MTDQSPDEASTQNGKKRRTQSIVDRATVTTTVRCEHRHHLSCQVVMVNDRPSRSTR